MKTLENVLVIDLKLHKQYTHVDNNGTIFEFDGIPVNFHPSKNFKFLSISLVQFFSIV
jgi:hypothetical protein